MNVLAFDCTPALDSSSPTLLVTAFLSGMREAGARVEMYCTRDLEIDPFRGDLSCWALPAATPRRRDDMLLLLPKLQDADIWVFATPVNASGMSGPMKTLLDRVSGLTLPHLELRDGRSYLVLHNQAKAGCIVLVASCVAWEVDTFEPLLSQIRAFGQSLGRQFVGALLRPHAPAMSRLIDGGMPVEDIFEAAYAAGQAIIAEGALPKQELLAVSRQLLPLDLYLRFVNEQLPRKVHKLVSHPSLLGRLEDRRKTKKRAGHGRAAVPAAR